MRYENYRIGDFFNITTGSLIDIKNTSKGNIPRISVKNDENGILGYFETENNEKARHAENFISVNFFGNAFYHPYKASVEMKVHCLKMKNKEYTEEIGLYLTAVLNKLFSQLNYSYGNQLSSTDLKNNDLFITLPTLDELDPNSPYSNEGFMPDFEYMAERISELEAERISELEAYLIASGLNDYELTEEDVAVLKTYLDNMSAGGAQPSSNYGSLSQVSKRKCEIFRVMDLFKLLKVTNKLSKENLSANYTYPAYSSDTTNNGIIGYTNNPEFVCDDKVPVYIVFGDHTRTFNIARESFSVLDNVKVLIPCCNNDNVLLYLTSVWQKQIPNLGYSRHWKVAQNCLFPLPIQTSAANNPIIDPECKYHPEGYIPDWDFMEQYIKAMEKVVIADVVKLKDEMIRKTKEVVTTNI